MSPHMAGLLGFLPLSESSLSKGEVTISPVVVTTEAPASTTPLAASMAMQPDRKTVMAAMAASVTGTRVKLSMALLRESPHD